MWKSATASIRVWARRARKLLAQAYPGGTARQEIRRRVILRTESGQIEAGAISAVLEEIVEGLAGIYAKEIEGLGIGGWPAGAALFP